MGYLTKEILTGFDKYKVAHESPWTHWSISDQSMKISMEWPASHEFVCVFRSIRRETPVHWAFMWCTRSGTCWWKWVIKSEIVSSPINNFACSSQLQIRAVLSNESLKVSFVTFSTFHAGSLLISWPLPVFCWRPWTSWCSRIMIGTFMRLPMMTTTSRSPTGFGFSLPLTFF